MKIEECKVGMRVFEKVYERAEGGWSIPQVGRQGTIRNVLTCSVRVQFDGEDGFVLFTSSRNMSKKGETIPWDRLRHISSVPQIEQARRLSLQKLAIVRRIKLIDATVSEAKNVDWDALADAVGALEFALAGLMRGARG